jgi:hypothetical protein
MAQQTAVEWAMSQIIRGHFIGFAEEFQNIYDKAKEMEKEQIIDAYKSGWDAGDFGSDCWEDIYFNETYGGGEQ